MNQQRRKSQQLKMPSPLRTTSRAGSSSRHEESENATNNQTMSSDNDHHHRSSAKTSTDIIHSGDTLESYVLPPRLRLHPRDVHFASSGIEVIKVSKNGKRQIRRIAISPHNRSVYVSSHGSTSYRVVSTLRTLKRGGGSDVSIGGGVNADAATNMITNDGVHPPLPVKEIDLSRVVRMQLGRQSRRFEKARSKSLKQSINPVKSRSNLSTSTNHPTNSTSSTVTNSINGGDSEQQHCKDNSNNNNDGYSLSIIYRLPNNNTSSSNVKDNINAMMTAVPLLSNGGNTTRALDDIEDSLDLIIPNKADYDLLARTIDDLLSLYKRLTPSQSPTYAFLQYHLIDMGKRLGTTTTSGGGNITTIKGGISCFDWVDLCRRWNAPVSKSDATVLYETYCESKARQQQQQTQQHNTTIQPEDLNFLDVVQLYSVLKQWCAESRCDASRGDAALDPRTELFERVANNTIFASSLPSTTNNNASESSSVSRINSPAEETGAFVKGFGRESNVNIATVSAATFLNFLIHVQNERDGTSVEDVKDLFAKLNGYQDSNADVVSTVDGVTWEREYISMECFARYLLLEANDVFDPERMAHSERSMSEPLNNYWINTSHDTYLRRTNTTKNAGDTDLQSYTLALYRGARAIELDVWDGANGNPVVRSGVSSFVDETCPSGSKRRNNIRSAGPSLLFVDVLSTVKSFLQSEPNSYPIILLIENHCSLPFQERMASDINAVLGKDNLLFRPYAPDVRTLPSPADLIGKVIIKSKRTGRELVLNDDFDDENRAAVTPSCTDYDSEDDLDELVIGFNSTGTIRSPVDGKMSLKELFQTANTEAVDSKSAANAVHNELLDATAIEQETRKHADALLRDIGMSYEELKLKRKQGGHNTVEEGTEVELSRDGDGAKVKECVDYALEMTKVFSESVEESRLISNAAAAEARSENELFDIAKADLFERETVLYDANEALQEVIKHNADLKEAAERALSEARTYREYEDVAKKRVESVRALLDQTHNQALSSETVANTADTEAKISEQRANDAMSRAKKARENAEEERKKAEQESKLEDDLELELASAMTKLSQARQSVDAARNRADKFISKANDVTDQISVMKTASKLNGISSPTSFDDDQSIVTLEDERKAYIGEMDNAFSDKLSRETRTRQLSLLVEDLSRKLKLQAKVAAAARRQTDHSIAVADQMEEHALEERDAAELRCVARERAKMSRKRSDDVMHSTEEQLAQAERAANEANELAISSRNNAERLSEELTSIQDPSFLRQLVEDAKNYRDSVHKMYEDAKASKEAADHRAAETKQSYEKDCIRLKTMEREAMAELLHLKSAQQAEFLAISACENAKAHSDRLAILKQKYENAKALAAEKAGALEIATRYKNKMIRLQPLSHELESLTFFHSCKHKSWEKSSLLHVCSIHSFPDTKVIEQGEKGKAEWSQWVQFNQNHLTRTFPQSSTRNYNPLLPWALGCQVVSLNFIRNQFMLLNDGRFRENGNQGYVLKPEYLCRNSLDESAVDDAMNCKHPRTINIQILSGYCLPKAEESTSSGSHTQQKRSISPFVKLTMYDGSPATFLKPPTHSTAVIKGNGLNPIWNDNEKSFTCLNPSVAMLQIVVYDHCEVSKSDLFIGASAIPVSCIREGYRSISLYDSNNTRSGAMRFASLFVKVQMEEV